MKRFNIILLADASGENVLMCKRCKPPYQGLYNLVGGKLESGEDGMHAAYRELREETGVTPADVTLAHLATFFYPCGGSGMKAYELQVYAGRLCHEVAIAEEVNPLVWMPLTENFFDMERFAGEGSIGHVVASVRRYQPWMLEQREPDLSLSPLTEEDLPILAQQSHMFRSDLGAMLEESQRKRHGEAYFEVFGIRVGGELVGAVSLYAHEEGTISAGPEVFVPFRRRGYAAKALRLAYRIAAQKGYTTALVQVRADNAASLALHRRLGFAVMRTCVNRKGNEVHDLTLALRPPMHHEMSLRPGPFGMIADGRKRYELRLHDEKRRTIAVGDTITFTCTADERRVYTRVVSLHPFGSFDELYAALPLTECGYTADNVHSADPRDMERYYPPEKQAQFGVLAIGLERIRLPLAVLNGAYTVRELTAEDVPQMLSVAMSNPLYYQYMHVQPDAENLAETLNALPPRRTMADKHFFGWFDGDELIALMDLIARHPEDDKAFIGWFIVDGKRQRCGLGRRLVGDVLAMLKNAGVEEVRLGRIVGNPQSEHFWRACGFADNGLHYDTEEYTVAVMRKSLA